MGTEAPKTHDNQKDRETKPGSLKLEHGLAEPDVKLVAVVDEVVSLKTPCPGKPCPSRPATVYRTSSRSEQGIVTEPSIEGDPGCFLGQHQVLSSPAANKNPLNSPPYMFSSPFNITKFSLFQPSPKQLLSPSNSLSLNTMSLLFQSPVGNPLGPLAPEMSWDGPQNTPSCSKLLQSIFSPSPLRSGMFNDNRQLCEFLDDFLGPDLQKYGDEVGLPPGAVPEEELIQHSATRKDIAEQDRSTDLMSPTEVKVQSRSDCPPSTGSHYKSVGKPPLSRRCRLDWSKLDYGGVTAENIDNNTSSRLSESGTPLASQQFQATHLDPLSLQPADPTNSFRQSDLPGRHPYGPRSHSQNISNIPNIFAEHALCSDTLRYATYDRDQEWIQASTEPAPDELPPQVQRYRNFGPSLQELRVIDVAPRSHPDLWDILGPPGTFTHPGTPDPSLRSSSPHMSPWAGYSFRGHPMSSLPYQEYTTPTQPNQQGGSPTVMGVGSQDYSQGARARDVQGAQGRPSRSSRAVRERTATPRVDIKADPDRGLTSSRHRAASTNSGGVESGITVAVTPTADTTEDPGAQVKTCHCKKSQCLKLYCDCFAAGQYCTNCSCSNCMNTEENVDLVLQRKNQITSRDPEAFSRKITTSGGGVKGRHKKGCNCRRSHCLKKYCECFQEGVRCTDQCKCTDCHNMDVASEEEERSTEHKVERAVRKVHPSPASNPPEYGMTTRGSKRKGKQAQTLSGTWQSASPSLPLDTVSPFNSDAPNLSPYNTPGPSNQSGLKRSSFSDPKPGLKQRPSSGQRHILTGPSQVVRRRIEGIGWSLPLLTTIETPSIYERVDAAIRGATESPPEPLCREDTAFSQQWHLSPSLQPNNVQNVQNESHSLQQGRSPPLCEGMQKGNKYLEALAPPPQEQSPKQWGMASHNFHYQRVSPIVGKDVFRASHYPELSKGRGRRSLAPFLAPDSDLGAQGQQTEEVGDLGVVEVSQPLSFPLTSPHVDAARQAVTLAVPSPSLPCTETLNSETTNLSTTSASDPCQQLPNKAPQQESSDKPEEGKSNTGAEEERTSSRCSLPAAAPLSALAARPDVKDHNATTLKRKANQQSGTNTFTPISGLLPVSQGMAMCVPGCFALDHPWPSMLSQPEAWQEDHRQLGLPDQGRDVADGPEDWARLRGFPKSGSQQAPPHSREADAVAHIHMPHNQDPDKRPKKRPRRIKERAEDTGRDEKLKDQTSVVTGIPHLRLNDPHPWPLPPPAPGASTCFPAWYPSMFGNLHPNYPYFDPSVASPPLSTPLCTDMQRLSSRGLQLSSPGLWRLEGTHYLPVSGPADPSGRPTQSSAEGHE